MKWDLTTIFKTKEEFLSEIDQFEKNIAKVAAYNNQLSDEVKFKEYFLLQKELVERFEKVYLYAHLNFDLNQKDVERASYMGKIMVNLHALNEALSFEEPEVLAIGKEKVMSFIDHNPELEEYRFNMEKLFRRTEHILDGKSEKLLSYYAPIASNGRDLYGYVSTADNVNKTIKLKNKEQVTVTHGNWSSLIQKSTNDSDRKKIFEALYEGFEKNKNTYAGIYDTIQKANFANCKARNYNSILESYLFNNNIPTSVYLNLVSVASTKNKSLKKYLKLRKKYLGLKQYHTYDRFLELARSNKEYTFEDAKQIFFDAIKDFPLDFQAKAKDALKDGFVDVIEKDGKRTGAYSSSISNFHPFILLNFSNVLDDVFTVAHEAGHSIHSLYAAEAQPTTLQQYTIFVAEIASTFNEHVLLDYFMNSSKATKDEKIMLLQKAIDEIYGTFYRQTLFAEYELEASKLVENHQVINYEVLSKIMIDLYKKYYGLDITKEKVKQYVWAYIPHLFKTPFYVYQYATSFAASFKIYKDVKNNVPGAFDRYINLLKSGGSKYPVEQAKEAGVDFTKKETFMAVVERLDELVDQLEKLLSE